MLLVKLSRGFVGTTIRISGNDATVQNRTAKDKIKHYTTTSLYADCCADKPNRIKRRAKK